MSFHRVKATSMTSGPSPYHPRDPAPMRTCLSSPRHLLRLQHHRCSAFGKSCSPLRLARGWPPLQEGLLLSPFHRWCHQQVGAPALFLCKNTCPQLVAVRWGVPRGSVIPYSTRVVSDAAPCQRCLHPGPCFPPTLPTRGATLALLLCVQTVSGGAGCPGQVGLHFRKTLPKAAREGSRGLVAVLMLPCQMGKPASCPAAQGRFLSCTDAALWLTPSLVLAWTGTGSRVVFCLSWGDILAKQPCSGVG